MKKTDLLTKLGIEDAFKDFSPKEESQLWGWGGDSQIYGAFINELKPSVVIDVGSWMGLSACNFAFNIKHHNLESTVICVDTWLGSLEHWTIPDLKQHLKLTNGYPNFYADFLSNIKKANLDNTIIPLPVPSSIGAEILKHYEVKANLVLIDASHLTRDVYDDLEAYWEILEPGGAVICRDYTWGTVKDAVLAFCAEVGCPHASDGAFAVLRKNI